MSEHTHRLELELELSNAAANALLRLVQADKGATIHSVIDEALLLSDALRHGPIDRRRLNAERQLLSAR
ncbi:MAG: hypothetical protein AAFR53_03055 [Pseudomonadota bacterium]